jgi:glyoxylase-like metal-dependent hydrolase (beta-lactamase superfamily II)
MHQLTPNLWATQSRSLHMNSGVYLSGREALLVDPGLHPDEIDSITQFAANQGATYLTILLTHWHWDHLFGPARIPAARVIAHSAYLTEVEANRAGLLRSAEDWRTRAGETQASAFQIPMPDQTLADGDTLALGDIALTFVHVPGHAADQLAVYQPEHGSLWASDILSDLEIPFVSHSLAAYEHTLAGLADHDTRVLVPGHGAVADAAGARSRLEADRAYLAELRERVSAAVQARRSMVETVQACAGMDYRHRADNEPYHRLNVESAYVELGGPADPARAGWAQAG